MGKSARILGALALLLAALAVMAVPVSGAGHRVQSARFRAHRQVHRAHKRAQARAAIIGGAPAADGAFPQLAFIQVDRGASHGWCTGTVAAPNVVLTAGHCAEDTQTGEPTEPSAFAVITGNADWTASPRQLSSVSRVLVYPGFDRESFTGDAALLILATPTTAPAIALASYQSDSARLQERTEARIAGWGVTYPAQGAPPKRLGWVRTVVQGSSYCESNAPPFDKSSELCTVDPPGYETGACHGDSGGPLIAQDPSGSGDLELGITSHVYGACSTARPSVFTRTDVIAPWVSGWIAAVNSASSPTPAPPPPAAATPAQQRPAPPLPPNLPGYYLTRSSKLRRVGIHVAADGRRIVGLKIKMPVPCRRGYPLSLEVSLLSDAASAAITNHLARETFEVPAGRASRTAQISLSVRFTGTGSLEGRLRVQIPRKNRRAGPCLAALRFAART